MAADTNEAPQASAPSASLSASNLGLDGDALAARMSWGQDLYTKVRDEALASYARRNPVPKASDEKAKKLIRLMVYLWNWGDIYGEGLWVRGADEDLQLMKEDPNEPLWKTYLIIKMILFFGVCGQREEDVLHMNQMLDDFIASDEPPALRMWACQAALHDALEFRESAHPDPSAASMQSLAHFTKLYADEFKLCIQDGWSDDALAMNAKSTMESVDLDEATLDTLHSQLAADFASAAPTNPTAQIIDGEYYIRSAWAARGSGYAGTVPADGWKKFSDRLDKAAAILEPLYDKCPKDSSVCDAMMTVELGQGKGRDRMELWYNRLTGIHPNSFAAALHKATYLLPRWYGSFDDDMAFAQQCVDTQDWKHSLPLILTYVVKKSNVPDVFAQAEVWDMVERVYRAYLDHYPDAVYYRTEFARYAYEGGHKDIAREQFKILGDSWDHTAVTDKEYADMIQDLNSK
jgi:hypothetical protein